MSIFDVNFGKGQQNSNSFSSQFPVINGAANGTAYIGGSLMPQISKPMDMVSLQGLTNQGVSTAGLPGIGGKLGNDNNGGDFTLFQKMFGGQQGDQKIGGSVGPIAQLGTGLMQGYLGMKSYGLAKKQLKQDRNQFNLNFDNQVDSTNSQLRDRQATRVASNPNAMPVEEYMKIHGLQERTA